MKIIRDVEELRKLDSDVLVFDSTLSAYLKRDAFDTLDGSINPAYAEGLPAYVVMDSKASRALQEKLLDLK